MNGSDFVLVLTKSHLSYFRLWVPSDGCRRLCSPNRLNYDAHVIRRTDPVYAAQAFLSRLAISMITVFVPPQCSADAWTAQPVLSNSGV